jgi:hypothetical protein
VDIDMDKAERDRLARIGRLMMPKAKDEKEAAEQIADAINNMSINENEVGIRLAEQHPTLQQNFMRTVVGFLQAMKAKSYTDARNEGSQRLAQKMIEGLDEGDLHLPFV